MGMGQELQDFAGGFKTGFSMGDKYNARKDNLAIAAGYESRADYDAAQKIKAEKGLLGTKGDPSAPRAPGTPSNTATTSSDEGGSGSSDGHKANSGDAQADPILDAIRPLEGGKKDPYNTALSHQNVGRLTGMTAQQWLDVYPRVKGAARVMGAYQFKDSTFRGLIERGKLDLSTVMTPQVQDQMGLELMKGRGWNDFKSGKIKASEFMNNMSQEWASLPDPNNGGRSHYKNEHLGISLNAFGKVLENAKSGTSSTASGGDQPADSGGGDTSKVIVNKKPLTVDEEKAAADKEAGKPVTATSGSDATTTSTVDDQSKAAPSVDATANPDDQAANTTGGTKTSPVPGRGGGPTAVAQANAKQNLLADNEDDYATDEQGNRRPMPKGTYIPPFETAQLDPTAVLGAPTVTQPTGPVLGPQPPPSLQNPSGVYGVSQAAQGGVMERPRRLGFAAGGAAPTTGGVPTNANQQGSGRAYTQALPASTAGAAPTQAAWTPRMIGQVAPGGGQNQPATSNSQQALRDAQAKVQAGIDARNAAAAQAPVHAQVDQGPFAHQAYVDSANRYYAANAPVRDPSTPPNRFTDPARAAAPYMDEGSWQALQPGYAQWAQQNNVGGAKPYGAMGYDDGGFVGGFASGLSSGFSTGRKFSKSRKSGITGRDSDTSASNNTDSSGSYNRGYDPDADSGSYNRGYTPDSDDSGSYNRGTQNAAGGGLMKGYGQKPQPKDEHDDDRSTRADRKEAPRSDESRPPAGRPYQEGGTGTTDKGVDYDPAYSTMGGGGPSPSYEPNNYDSQPSGMTMPELHELGDKEDARRRAASGIPLAHRNVSAASGDTRPPNTSELHDPGGSLPTPGDPGYHRPVNEEYDTDRKPSDIVSSGPELSEMDKSETARKQAALPRDQEDRDYRSSRAAALARLEARDKAYINLDRTQGDRATRAGTEDKMSTPESTAQSDEGPGTIPTPPPRPGDIDTPDAPPTPPTKTAQAAPAAGSPAASPIPTPPPRPAILGGADGVAQPAGGETPSQVTATQPDQPPTPPTDQAATPPTPPTPPPSTEGGVLGGYPQPPTPPTPPPAAPAASTPPPAAAPTDGGWHPFSPNTPATPPPAAPAASPIPTPGAPTTPSIPGNGQAVPGTGAGAAKPSTGGPSNLGETNPHPHVKPVVKQGTKVNDGGIVTHQEIQESTKAGLGSLSKGLGQAGSMNKGFGVPQRGGSPSDNVTPAQKAFASNDNAIDPQTMAQLKQQVDPQNKLSEAEKTMKVQQDLYDFYMSHGYQTKAAGVAAGVLMYGRRISQLAGNMAQAALEKGDVVTASAWMAKAYDNMPDGHELRVSKPDANGNVTYQLVDLQSGEAGEIKTATPDDMMTMAKSMASGALWATATIDVAQGTGVGVGGGGVGKGKGGGSRPPGSLTESQRLTQEQKAKVNDAMDGLGSAIDAYNSDKSDENKAAVLKAAQDARTAGGNASNINNLVKAIGLQPVTPTKGTQKDRDNAAFDQSITDAQAKEKDPQKKARIPLDLTFERQLKSTKTVEDDKNIEDAMGTAPQPVVDIVKKVVGPFAKANGLKASVAAGYLMQIINGSGINISADGRQLDVEDLGESLYINSKILTAIQNAKAALKNG